jgi:hypothetical protein
MGRGRRVGGLGRASGCRQLRTRQTFETKQFECD